jgi:glucose dehydrogenase
MLVAAGDAATLMGAMLVYLASRNQPLMGNAKRRKLAGWLGAALLAAGLLLLLAGMRPASAVFTAVTLAMLVWSLAPLAAAWWCRPREEQP